MLSDSEVDTESSHKRVLHCFQAGILMIRWKGICTPFTKVQKHTRLYSQLHLLWCCTTKCYGWGIMCLQGRVWSWRSLSTHPPP